MEEPKLKARKTGISGLLETAQDALENVKTIPALTVEFRINDYVKLTFPAENPDDAFNKVEEINETILKRQARRPD